jgi:hypothetical protein
MKDIVNKKIGIDFKASYEYEVWGFYGSGSGAGLLNGNGFGDGYGNSNGDGYEDENEIGYGDFNGNGGSRIK